MLTKKYKSICMQQEKYTLEPQQVFPILDEHKIPQEGKILEGAYDVTIECDKCLISPQWCVNINYYIATIF